MTGATMAGAVIQWPDKRLSQVAQPVEAVTDDIRSLWTRMIDVMEAMPGVGLAAPQLGVLLRVAVVDASDIRGQVVRLANPELLWASDDMRSGPEASPNLPGVSAVITRPAAVRVGFLDDTGAAVERDFEGLWATSVQHQIDHLNGKLFVDRLSRTRRDMILRKVRRRARA